MCVYNFGRVKKFKIDLMCKWRKLNKSHEVAARQASYELSRTWITW